MIWLENVCKLRFMWLFQKFDLELMLCFAIVEINDLKLYIYYFNMIII
jgi:hypothetical protein